MVKQIVLHIEGGRDRTADVEFRRAFRTFFSDLIAYGNKRQITIQVILEGGRKEAYDRFCKVVHSDPDVWHVLIVDSESPVKEFGQCWKHLKERQEDQWERPANVEEAQCHLMVMAMEAWFFADPDALEHYYNPLNKHKFHRNALPKNRNVEQILKEQHVSKIEAAIKDIPKRNIYLKMKDGPAILERLNVEKVRQAAKHCERIFVELTKKMGGDE